MPTLRDAPRREPVRKTSATIEYKPGDRPRQSKAPVRPAGDSFIEGRKPFSRPAAIGSTTAAAACSPARSRFVPMASMNLDVRAEGPPRDLDPDSASERPRIIGCQARGGFRLVRSDRASRGNEMPSGVSGGEPRTPEGLWGPSPAGGSDRPGVVRRDDIEGGSRPEFAQSCLGMIAGRSSRSRPGRSRGCCEERRLPQKTDPDAAEALVTGSSSFTDRVSRTARRFPRNLTAGRCCRGVLSTKFPGSLEWWTGDRFVLGLAVAQSTRFRRERAAEPLCSDLCVSVVPGSLISDLCVSVVPSSEWRPGSLDIVSAARPNSGRAPRPDRSAARPRPPATRRTCRPIP